MDISKELYDFISAFSEKHLRKKLDYNKINCSTTLDEIGIDDLDLDLMLGQFSEKYKIDYSKFNSKRYYGIGLWLIDNNARLIRAIIGNRKWLPLPKEERKPFTLGNLESAIKTGILE
ncbi:MAG: DUF1493 family protein [Urechidicola sp.]|nr:DUF1493 family protein [Urechidicola sp.]